jgi:hypothetical protein
MSLGVVAGVAKVLASWGGLDLDSLENNTWYELPPELQGRDDEDLNFSGLRKLRAVTVDEEQLHLWPEIRAMAQLYHLSSLTLKPGRYHARSIAWDPSTLLSTPQFASRLRRLELEGCGRLVLPHLSLLSQLTWLRFTGEAATRVELADGLPPCAVVTEQLSRLRQLRWLSVPGWLLNEGVGWLSSLQQLRALNLTDVPYDADSDDMEGSWP